MKKNQKPKNQLNTVAQPFSADGLEIYSSDGELWMRGNAICQALGYRHPDKGMSDIFKRHEDEFTADMTRLMPMKTAGGVQELRVFSLRGAHLLAIFARSEHAKEFRKWVLDLIEQQHRQPGRTAEALMLRGEADKGVKLRDMMGAMEQGHHQLNDNALSWVFGHAREDMDRLQHKVANVAHQLEGDDERGAIHAVDVQKIR